MSQREIRLLRDTIATVIPAGSRVLLPEGSMVEITQARGGTITVRDGGGIYRIEGEEIEALGPDVVAQAQADTLNIDPDADFSEDQVWQVLKTCFDPEIPINIVDLGLIYDLAARPLDSGKHHVDVRMTLTATGCGMGPAIAADAQRKIEALPGVETADVQIVWDPQWSPHMISPEGRKVLGLDE